MEIEIEVGSYESLMNNTVYNLGMAKEKHKGLEEQVEELQQVNMNLRSKLQTETEHLKHLLLKEQEQANANTEQLKKSGLTMLALKTRNSFLENTVRELENKLILLEQQEEQRRQHQQQEQLEKQEEEALVMSTSKEREGEVNKEM